MTGAIAGYMPWLPATPAPEPYAPDAAIGDVPHQGRKRCAGCDEVKVWPDSFRRDWQYGPTAHCNSCLGRVDGRTLTGRKRMSQRAAWRDPARGKS